MNLIEEKNIIDMYTTCKLEIIPFPLAKFLQTKKKSSLVTNSLVDVLA